MILGFNLNEINARSNEKEMKGNLEVNSSPSIEDVVEKKFDFLGENKSVGIKFAFRTNYGMAGEIVQKGEVIYKVDDAKKIVKKWKDEKKLDEETTLTVLNFILSKCLVKSIELADVLRLPPPMQFPHVTREQAPQTPKIVETKKK